MKLRTIDEVADDLRISRDGVRDLIDTKQIRAARIGRLWRIDGDSVTDYLNQAMSGGAIAPVNDEVQEMVARLKRAK